VTAELSTRTLTQLLLRLHEHAQELGYRPFQQFCLAEMAKLVPFDAGLLGMGTIQEGVPHGHDVLLDRRPAEFMESWNRIKQEDRVALAAMREPDRTHAFDVTGAIFEGCDEAREHCRQWRIAHVMCTASIDADSGLYRVMSIYREQAAQPFSEAERAATELIVPHLFAAARQARIGQLRARMSAGSGHGLAAAIAGDKGLVLEAEPSFVDVLRSEWPAFRGPWLPAKLWDELGHTDPRERCFERIFVRVRPVEGVWLAEARRRIAADALTTREREVAQAFARGDSHREIGERLGVSPNTVRRHLANTYEKLGIASKAELDRMLSPD
jgi:DNA-binding CsgD family transcriptional regulator